ncbi:MAG: hypothetical protein EOO81_02230 [Oxalobacteraceae bacterium]|nr:MAG: hypothetical protein EOO81_02230 [Oxalobacteraceae bacterium]
MNQQDDGAHSQWWEGLSTSERAKWDAMARSTGISAWELKKPTIFNIGVTTAEHRGLLDRAVHPCEIWAQGANHQSWEDAVSAMKGGKVLCGTAPRVGKTNLDVTMFFDRVRAAGLHAYPTDIGQVYVGLKENFSSEMLARQEKEARINRLLRGMT